MKTKRFHINIKTIVGIFCVMCLLAEASNIFLKKNYAYKFENDIQVSESEIKTTKKTNDGKYVYKILKDKKSIILKSYNCFDEKDVIVPSKIDGYKVIGLDDSVFACHEEMKSIEIPDSVEKTEMATFGGCTNLKKILFKGDVKQVSKWTFLDCKGIVVAKNNSNIEKCAKKQGMKVEIEN